MLACLPTESATGLDDHLHGHFGSAPYFTLVDLDSGEVTILDNARDPHEHGQCAPLGRLAEHRVDCFVVGGMGRGAIMALNQAGIRVYRTEPAPVRDVLEALRDGRLLEIDPASACQGHGGGQGGCAHG